MIETRSGDFKILSLDGGGVRGIFSAQLLDLIEKKLNVSVYSSFDLVVGTSVGSIVAGFVAANLEMAELVCRFEGCAKHLFKRNRFSCGLLKSKYRKSDLKQFLIDSFDNLKLGEIDKPLILNASNMSTGSVHVFKSAYQKNQRKADYVRDGDVRLYEAVLASCAAPTYFDPVIISGDLICDGGIWANNPALVGFVDAVNNFKRSPDNIKILSIGTGYSGQFYNSANNWGLLTGWKHRKIVEFAMLNQTQHIDNCMKLIMPGNIFRVNPMIGNWRLDNHKIIPILKSMALKEISHNGESIKDFLCN